jgi:regulator of sigma E protease
MSGTAIFLFFIILLALVIVHEFGHFIVAKWVNMRVDEFAFGFPPRLFAKKKGETAYAVNALPLGGYVSIWGENGEPDDEAKHHPRAFGNRPKWAQILVLLAGVAMNMLLALVIFIGISFGKVQMSTSDEVYGSRVKDRVIMVMEAAPNSPAHLAGIVPGSVITKLSSAGQNAKLTTAESAIAFVTAHQNDPFDISYVKPDGSSSRTVVAAVYGIIPDKKALGISLDTVGYVTTTPLEAVKIGSTRTYDMTVLTLQGLWSLVSSIGSGGNVLESLSGPIGIARIVGETSEYGYAAVLTLVAILSINLAIFNALPLPALDGGRIVVVLIEAIGRRKIPFKYYSWVNISGFAALMLLLIVVTINDVLR